MKFTEEKLERTFTELFGNSDTIDHPFPETIDHLKQNLQSIINKGFQLLKQNFYRWSITNENRWSMPPNFQLATIIKKGII